MSTQDTGRKLQKNSFPPRLQLKQTKTFFFLSLFGQQFDAKTFVIDNQQLTFNPER